MITLLYISRAEQIPLLQAHENITTGAPRDIHKLFSTKFQYENLLTSVFSSSVASFIRSSIFSVNSSTIFTYFVQFLIN